MCKLVHSSVHGIYFWVQKPSGCGKLILGIGYMSLLGHAGTKLSLISFYI